MSKTDNDQKEMIEQYQELKDKFLVPKTLKDAKQRSFKFWKTQPVPELEEIITIEGEIKTANNHQIKQDQYNLPPGYKWVTYDMKNSNDCSVVSKFLDKYYVEDDDNEFRLHYSSKFLSWALTGPYYDPNLCIGVVKGDILVGFISGIITRNQLNNKSVKMAEINFLCIHRAVRKKRLTTVLIREITRRINLVGVYQAMYTGERYLPKPFCRIKSYHRPLNPTPLLKTGFLTVEKNIKLNDLKRSFKLPNEPLNENFKKMEEKHLSESLEKLNEYLSKYNCHPIFSIEEFKHIFLNNNFVVSYVVEKDNHVTDFISYYKLQSKVLKKNKQIKYINAGYLYYYTSLEETPFRLIKDIMIVARNNGLDVLNATDMMENESLMRELRFGEGTGILYYYMYNWKLREIKPNQLAKSFY